MSKLSALDSHFELSAESTNDSHVRILLMPTLSVLPPAPAYDREQHHLISYINVMLIIHTIPTLSNHEQESRSSDIRTKRNSSASFAPGVKTQVSNAVMLKSNPDLVSCADIYYRTQKRVVSRDCLACSYRCSCHTSSAPQTLHNSILWH
jgi:hypothetical protein